MASFSFQTVPQLHIGAGMLRSLPQLLVRLGPARRPLVVTDPGVLAAGLATPLVDALAAEGACVGLFSAIVPDPPESTVLEAVEAGRAHGADLVIGLGGGSAMDTAKLVALLIEHEQPLAALYGVDAVRGHRRRPLVLVPTTAGTGSEVTCISIVTTGATTKQGIVSPQLYADMALLDGDLTLGLPPHVTAHTGIDALVHAIEAYTSRLRKNPLSDGLARQALAQLVPNLPRVLADGSDRDARQAMLLGACLAGQAFANAPVAAVHALAYPLGGQFHLSHGLSNALMLVPVLRFNRPAAAHLYDELAPLFGAGDADGMIDAVAALCRAAGVAQRLRDVAIPADALERLAQAAMGQSRLLTNNPRPLGLDDARALYEAAW